MDMGKDEGRWEDDQNILQEILIEITVTNHLPRFKEKITRRGMRH